MIPEERERIYSEEYADLLIEYNGDFTVFDEFPNATVQIINYIYAVVRIPVELVNPLIITERGYSVLPFLLGLVSQASLEASGVLRIRGIPGFDLRGQGVLIGIIDTGIDYLNPIFQYADNTTRIASIWDQTIISDDFPPDFGYGTVYSKEQINEALQSENPLQIVPSMDLIGHGTMLAGIAGGNEVADSNFYGVAPEAEFVVVKLKPAKQFLKNFFFISEDAVAYQSTDVLFGIQYLLNETVRLDRPMAICMALGSSMGGHDGRGILANYLSLISSRQGVAVLCAAGNEGNARRHYFGRVDQNIGYDTVELNVSEGETGFTMEIWGQSPSIFSVDITTPTGEYVPRIAASLDENREITFVLEQTVIYLDYIMVESQSGDQLILIRFQNPTSGIWRFNVYERGDINLGFHIWLPMANFISNNTYFIRPDPYTTVLALGNALVPITVTAYNHEDDSLYLDASRGYTRTGRIKPEIAAPGVGIIGPTLEQGFTEYTGTSVATAHTTGVTALMLEWGIVRGNLPGLSTVEIKKLFIRGARRDIDIVYPNRDWGYGILDIYNVFDRLRTGAVV
ncbi:S8 family serine peptidase [Mobilitalea sibirica]|uniref:S8 family serine peptidase n=1 Tax=Mobilitalea sibirica TaxID=1462919 RepID=A0A8J7H926_9FIRM|nr:S8 family serine peptidase [Mobilitalea sibirica]MBH1940730.1 S8 family serine peptidase [Mobilitalea sibirica]